MSYNSSNPILTPGTFARATADGDSATLSGTINRCFVLLALVFGSAVFSWYAPGATMAEVVSKVTLFSILAFVVAMVTRFKMEWSGIMAPLYAILEGLALGAISRIFEMAYKGIVFQAVLLTFGVAFAVLFLYRTGMIKATERFRAIMMAALFGVMLVYLANIVLSFFGISIPMIHSSGPAGLIFSGIVVFLAALTLVLDFEFIVQVSQGGLPKYMSWYAAFGLIVGLVWLYMEILHLLAKLKDN